MFDGKFGLCDFYNNSTHTGNISNCHVYNDDVIHTCKTCSEGFVTQDGVSCLHESACSHG